MGWAIASTPAVDTGPASGGYIHDVTDGVRLNAKSATNIGAELELRKGLEFLAKKEAPARRVLRNFSLGANFAYVYSRVQLLPPCYLPGEAPPSNVPNPEDYVEREDCKPAIDAVTSRERPP